MSSLCVGLSIFLPSERERELCVLVVTRRECQACVNDLKVFPLVNGVEGVLRCVALKISGLLLQRAVDYSG